MYNFKILNKYTNQVFRFHFGLEVVSEWLQGEHDLGETVGYRAYLEREGICVGVVVGVGMVVGGVNEGGFTFFLLFVLFIVFVFK